MIQSTGHPPPEGINPGKSLPEGDVPLTNIQKTRN